MQRMGLHGWTVRPSSGCVFCLSQRLATLAQQRVPKLSKERSARWPPLNQKGTYGELKLVAKRYIVNTFVVPLWLL